MNIGMDDFNVNRFSNIPRESPTPDKPYDTRDTMPLQLDKRGKISIFQLKGKRKYRFTN